MSDSTDYSRLLIEETETGRKSKELMVTMITHLVHMNDEGDADYQETAIRLLPLAIDEEIEPFLEENAQLVGSYYSKEELIQVLEFYKTPLGRKVLEQHDATKDRATAIGEAFGQRIWANLEKKLDAAKTEL